jgi:threonyl-tRNA synthetase
MKVYVNDEEIEIDDKASALDLAKKLNLTNPDQALAVFINDNLYDITCSLSPKDKVKFLNFQDKEGKETYWHTSAHILAQAVLRLYPKAKPTIGPSIENGFYYDFADLSISENDFPKIEKEVKKIISEKIPTEVEEFKNKEEAIKAFSNNPFKKELIEDFEEGKITAYRHSEFFDLCRGPHLLNTGKVKAFKILKTSGAYWRGDSKNQMLTRIYGISFPDKKMLADYLNFLEEAKKREHKKIGKQLDLFSFREEAAGMVFLHPKGMFLWNTLLNFLKNELKKANYLEIKTPILMCKELWEKSGHWAHYKKNMYLSKIEEKECAIKPMNCPGCMLFYKTKSHSYRELPLRVGEIGHVHRHEPSGALNGLFRVRSFHQDDAHVFMKEEDVKYEILNILTLVDKIYMTFGLSYKLELSTRPEKSKTIGSDKDWEITTKALKEALIDWGHSYTLNEGEGAFYGPKIDVHIKDAIGRFWQCATIQLDMSLPEKFDLKYIASTGVQKRPLMVHRTIYGSIERFLGILVEHFSGNFPFWLSPLPIRIITVADRHIEYAEKLKEKIDELDINCDVDKTNESVSKKIRNAQLLKINYMLTVGDKEMENKNISLRTRIGTLKEENIDSFIEKILKEKNNKELMSPYEK